MTKMKLILPLSILMLAALACNALIPPPVSEAQPISPLDLPTREVILTEANLPRVTVDDAKTAFDNGTAIIVDVRSEQAFAASHIPGAINIQLGEFETNPTELDLPKDQWIITYCT